MGLVGVEAVFAAMTTKLQTDMPAKVTALNAIYADAFALTEIPAESYYDYVPGVEGPTFGFPAIILRDETAKGDPEQSNPALQVVRYAVTVVVVVLGSDAEDLTKRLWRYDRAAKEILLARHSLAPTCTTCVYDETTNNRVTDPDSGDFLQDRASRFFITTAETTA